MNISHDFVQRFERVKEDFKKSMFRDLCRQVDAWFAPLLAELKASVVVEGAVSPGPQSMVDVDTSRDDAGSHFSLSTSLLEHHQSSENGLIINSNDHLLVGDPFWGSGGVVPDVPDVVVPSTIGRDSAEELSVGVDSIIASASSTPVNIIESTSSSLTAGGTVTDVKEELDSDHEETMDDRESAELFGEDEGSINCDCSDCRSEEEEEHEGELFSSKKVKLERQLSDEIVFDGSPPPGTNFFEISSSSSHHESASAPSPLGHSLVKTTNFPDKIHFCKNSTCHESFRKHCQLVAHQRSHWSTRFRCKWPGCKSDFASRSNIYRHLRSAHHPFEQQGQADGEQDLKHLIEEITSETKNSATSALVTTSLEPQGSTSLGSSGSSSSSGSSTQKCYRCKWPLCDYTGEHSGNITRHIRTQHFNLPRTVREQRDKNIVDDRDPYAFVEVFHKSATTVSGQAVPVQRLGGSVTDGSGGADNESQAYGGVVPTDDGFGCSNSKIATTATSTQVSSSSAADLYVSGVFNQMKEDSGSAQAAPLGKSETKAKEMMTTLAATAVAAAAAVAAVASTSSTSMDFSDTDDPENCTYHF